MSQDSTRESDVKKNEDICSVSVRARDLKGILIMTKELIFLCNLSCCGQCCHFCSI